MLACSVVAHCFAPLAAWLLAGLSLCRGHILRPSLSPQSGANATADELRPRGSMASCRSTCFGLALLVSAAIARPHAKRRLDGSHSVMWQLRTVKESSSAPTFLLSPPYTPHVRLTFNPLSLRRVLSVGDVPQDQQTS
ncbi:hypothetical protein GBF38_006214 [Nibea albiflora]|uniref:Uncharacterized protein n=1 Tax=Nibea albiflora TaxID=240163 RepID=A0ACB7FAY0_NIBAL|nr:hypothetical protein GBF38_006214 [Nibea albiflora]